MAFLLRLLFGTYEKQGSGPRKLLLSLSLFVHQHRQLHASLTLYMVRYRRTVLNNPFPHEDTYLSS